MNSARVEKSADKLLKIMEKDIKRVGICINRKRQRCNMVSFFGRLTRGESERELTASCQIVKLNNRSIDTSTNACLTLNINHIFTS